MKKQEMKKFEIFTRHMIHARNGYSLLLRQAAIDGDAVNWEIYKRLRREFVELIDFARRLN